MVRVASKKLAPRPNGIFWSMRPGHIDLERDKNYLIHQTLAYGTWNDLQWLFQTYPVSTIKKVFIASPEKVYSASAFNFAKNILLELEARRLLQKRYVTSFPRIAR